MADRLIIEGLQLFGYHGVLAEERERGQLFSLDIELEFDFPAGDELAQTIDYVRVIETAQRVNETGSFQLLESLAQALAERVLGDFALVQRVRVRACKQHPPLGILVNSVTAEVVRARV